MIKFEFNLQNHLQIKPQIVDKIIASFELSKYTRKNIFLSLFMNDRRTFDTHYFGRITNFLKNQFDPSELESGRGKKEFFAFDW